MTLPALDAEWLETDATGGFASGTVGGLRTRRHHALLQVARRPPADRVALVNGFEAWADFGGESLPLSTQHYTPDVVHPRGVDHLVAFASEPWPAWTFRGPGGIEIVHELVVDRVDGSVVLTWRMASSAPAATLTVRPLVSARDYRALTRENAAFAFDALAAGGSASWRPYAGVPAIAALTNGRYRHDPLWYRNFHYREEAARGLDCVEDLASPGTFAFDISRAPACMVLRAGDGVGVDAEALAERIRASESARRGASSALDRAADAYIVRRGSGHTIIAGYPWFTDWGRDTFIAMRGLLIGRGKHAIAASILLTWAQFVSEGMLPNRFPDYREEPEYNAVDASLWYVIAVHEYLAAANAEAAVRARLLAAVTQILDGYAAGTRFGIRMDDDGLLACGGPGTQLTWMDVDVRIGEQAVTCRAGKPVEVEALWVNALRCAGGRYAALADRATLAFNTRFWNAQAGCLYDVVDVDHERGRVDASVRPNQVFAVGGLPWRLVTAEHAHAVVATIERELLTPLGLRTLSPRAAGYRRRYEGDRWQRDTAYHQGTAWPWLTGAFVDAWFAVHGDDAAHRAEARERFVAPLCAHLAVAGLGHVSEIADGDAPHTPRGCPFQAWSLGELLRMLARTAA